MMNTTFTHPQLQLPPLVERERMLDVLQREEYGYLPPKPDKMTCTAQRLHPHFCGGKATLDKVTLTCEMGSQRFSFPVYCAIPSTRGPHTFFVSINFRDSVPDMYMPTEEIIDNGFAVLSFCYQDVTGDDGDFTGGLAGVLYKDKARGESDPGKIAMWAWAAHRVMDYAQTVERLNPNRGIVCGHSRLGKTALLAAATDERFAAVYANNSGCSGAAITRGKAGERVADITANFPYWFCEKYQQYSGREHTMPFDQHWLIASVAPRMVFVGSAGEDIWADPAAEKQGCMAAAPAWETLGKPGFVCLGNMESLLERYKRGSVGYHIRAGQHFFTRYDWHQLMRFVEIRIGKWHEDND